MQHKGLPYISTMCGVYIESGKSKFLCKKVPSYTYIFHTYTAATVLQSIKTINLGLHCFLHFLKFYDQLLQKNVVSLELDPAVACSMILKLNGVSFIPCDIMSHKSLTRVIWRKKSGLIYMKFITIKFLFGTYFWPRIFWISDKLIYISILCTCLSKQLTNALLHASKTFIHNTVG